MRKTFSRTAIVVFAQKFTIMIGWTRVDRVVNFTRGTCDRLTSGIFQSLDHWHIHRLRNLNMMLN